jgi:shikimate kinase
MREWQAFADAHQRCIAPHAMLQSAPSTNLWTGQPIVLVGLMGAGKSTVGRRLATRLHLPFVDADHEIETAAGMTVSDIFERFGEAHFRDGERRVIARLMDGKTKVIATGGGAFINDDTRATILQASLAIWLDAQPDVLAERVGRRDTRPLLRGKDPKIVLSELAAVRNPFYAEAHLRVPSNHAPHEVTVNAILKAIGQ